jgi:hypothetical protein
MLPLHQLLRQSRYPLRMPEERSLSELALSIKNFEAAQRSEVSSEGIDNASPEVEKWLARFVKPKASAIKSMCERVTEQLGQTKTVADYFSGFFCAKRSMVSILRRALCAYWQFYSI